MRPPSLDLAVVGNSNVAALIDRDARLVWMCWPRIDGDPVFCALLDGSEPDGGFFAIEAEGGAATGQVYVRNTAIVRTEFAAAGGAGFAVTDFAPRFRRFDRIFRPPMIVRRVEPLGGIARLRVRVRPRFGNGEVRPAPVTGSNHIRFGSEIGSIRVTTDAPVSRIADEAEFALTRPLTFVIHADEPLTETIADLGSGFLEKTRDYWLDWVRFLHVPYEWQEAVIRAAITLKLCSFEETGAIVAALTTSIPEAPGSGRTWDYRYCWIRDAYFTVRALNRLGATLTMERFLDYVTDLIAGHPDGMLRPVYGILPHRGLPETIATGLRGYRQEGPVRIGNAAVDQQQNDVFGSVVLSVSQMFFDERLPSPGSRALFDTLEPLGRAALARALEPDAGIWEYRQRARIHTHSAVMCWAAADRLARIAGRLGVVDRAASWRSAADGLRQQILARAWNERLGCFAGSLDTDEIDASALLLHQLGIVDAGDPRFVATVDRIGKRLARNNFVLRYDAADDFGDPTVSFAICSFWYVEALAAVGRRDEARALYETLLARRNHVGLLSEDIDPVSGELWGNFPQTYSMVGIIGGAMSLSSGWESAQ